MENSKIKTALIDGYLDEPSCLGVPPYISPHIRYTYGALLEAGIKEKNLKYITIDQLREKKEEMIDKLESMDLVIIIAGTTVPGHYMGGKPISLKEIRNLSSRVYYPQKVIGGPLTLVKKNIEGFDHICGETAAFDLYQLLADQKIPEKDITQYIKSWAVRGAKLTRRHPSYPYLVCELETFRGCPREKHCAFCSERLKKMHYQRPSEDIKAEVTALAEHGNHFYRLGCQTDLLLYQYNHYDDKKIPNPAAVKNLYQGIREADPDLKVLHLDNINPVNIVKFPQQSREILQTIIKYNTSGDTAAFGLESADPHVLEKNNIESRPEDVLKAVQIMNELGAKRKNGMPQLLPGINFIHGLIGERRESTEFNYRFLKNIYDEGLMLRRINIRQVVNTGGYPSAHFDRKNFLDYKEKVNQEINQPMLKRVFPAGTILNNVYIETTKGNLSYGRQPGSYPILIGIPGRLKLNQFIDVYVIDHGYRSITALPYPLNIKKASIDQLAAIPGIGKKRASNIFLNQPKNLKELSRLLDKNFPLEKWQECFKW